MRVLRRGTFSPNFQLDHTAWKLCDGREKVMRSKNCTDVLYHHATLGEVLTSRPAGGQKDRCFNVYRQYAGIFPSVAS